MGPRRTATSLSLSESEAHRRTEDSTISSLQQPDDYHAVVIAKSKWRYRNSLIFLAITVGLLLFSILTYLTAYAINAYINLHSPKPYIAKPFLHVSPANSKAYINPNPSPSPTPNPGPSPSPNPN